VWVIVFDVPYEVSCTTTSSDGSMSPQALLILAGIGRFVPLDCVHVRGQSHSTCHMFSTDAISSEHTGTDHPTIKNADEGLSILARFASDLQLPTPEEGYDRIISLAASDQPLSYTSEQVAAVLQRLRDSPLVTSPSLPASFRLSPIPPSRGSSRGSFPGRAAHSFPTNSRGGGTFRGYASNSPRRATHFARGRFSAPVVTAAQPLSGIGHTADIVRAGSSDGIVQSVVVVASEPAPEGSTTVKKSGDGEAITDLITAVPGHPG